jgi:orotidine-5'-phosphate decarboxylase
MGTQTPTLEKLGLDYLIRMTMNDVFAIFTMQGIKSVNKDNIAECKAQLSNTTQAYALIFEDGKLDDIKNVTIQFELAGNLALDRHTHIFIATKEQFQLRN